MIEQFGPGRVMATPYVRKHPTTGFWVFYCNTSLWRGDEWLALGEERIWYKVSDHHRNEMRAGQRGVIRFSKRAGSVTSRRPPLEVGIYALVEVLGPAEFRADDDLRHYGRNTELPAPTWRAPLRILENLVERPVLARTLPTDADFGPIQKGQQTASVAIVERAYRQIEALAGTATALTFETASALSDQELADRPDGLAWLEKCGRENPERQSRLSRYIERGAIGQKIKRERGGRCQFCEAMGRDPVCFMARSGKPYAEAHHVVPVSEMKDGSLGRANIVILCPNHHRQAHYGDIQYKDQGSYWIFTIDGRPLKIEKSLASPVGR